MPITLALWLGGWLWQEQLNDPWLTIYIVATGLCSMLTLLSGMLALYRHGWLRKRDQIDQYLRPPNSAEIMIVIQADLVYCLMSYLRRKNLRVPQDVAIVSMEEGIGFDLMFSPVTCLRKPLSGMALKVSNMIWSEVRNSGKSKYKRQVNIASELIVRNSCGTI